MAPSDNQALDDGQLRQYLLGALPDADAERLHELSITDDELAGRLDQCKAEGCAGRRKKSGFCQLPCSLLKQQNYIVDVKGIPRHGAAEVISGYPFRVVLQ